jgi:3-dehydroquinate dehydratase-2
MIRIAILNGPNLNLLGKREPEIYGNRSFESYFDELVKRFPTIELDYFQSNHEGSLIDKLQEIGFDYDGIVLNAGAYTHTSIALADCIKAITTPVIEVHISNPKQRESFRHISYIEPVCLTTYAGYGLDSYRLAIDDLLKRLKK